MSTNVRKLTTKGKDGEEISWRVEEIENGFLVSKEYNEKPKKGSDYGRWVCKKYFTDKNPLDGFKPDFDIIENSMNNKE